MFRYDDKPSLLPRPTFGAIPEALPHALDLMIAIAKALKNAKHFDKTGPISILTNAIEKKASSFIEITTNSFFLFLVGYETTASLITSSLVYLSEHRDKLESIKSNSEKLDGFINEMLRYYTPAGRFLRRVESDFQIDGNVIPKGSIVILLLGAANTDSAIFENPFLIDFDRLNNKHHLSFGKGKHACIGAPLSKLQAKTALNDLLKVIKSIEIDEADKYVMIDNRDIGIYGRESLRVKFEWVTTT